jgi:hypothetical protein
MPRNGKLAVRIEPNPRPDIARAFWSLFRGRHVLLFRVAKCPRLIDLYAAAWQVHQNTVLILRKCLPCID